MRVRWMSLVVALGTASCASSLPPRWAPGGSPLALGRATWTTGEGVPVVLEADGTVTVDGTVSLLVDRAGRVYDEDREPVAVLLPDGNLAGPDDLHLGRVGVTNASAPGSSTAWLAVLPDGAVVHFDPDGEQSTDGVWRGCDGAVHRTCTLVTQLVTLQRVAAAAAPGYVYLGVGAGFYY